jgi:chromosome segregation ATPase
MNKSINLIFKAGLLWMVGLLWAAAVQCEETPSSANYYRYLNKDGVKVISSTIPPEYAQKGYEVVTLTGRIIKTVPPAPEASEMQRKEAERALLAEYEVLARRYSSVADVYSARDRRLAQLDANIAILRSNVANLKGQLQSLTTRAAEAERSGREVPAPILKSIQDARAELALTEENLTSRNAEHKAIHDDFDRQVELLQKGRVLLDSQAKGGKK